MKAEKPNLSIVEDHNKPQPEQLPEPTYWPFFTALGVVLLLWGILTNIVISLIGLATFIVALGGWLTDLYHENKQEQDEL